MKRDDFFGETYRDIGHIVLDFLETYRDIGHIVICKTY
jgi:hypothetical protein